MTLKGEKVTEINQDFNKVLANGNRLNLNVGTDGYFSDSVYSNGWQVCKIDDLREMIKRLGDLLSVIETATGTYIK